MCGINSARPDFVDASKGMRWEYDDGPSGEKNGDADWYCSRVFKKGWLYKYRGVLGKDGKPIEPRVAFLAALKLDLRIKETFMAEVRRQLIRFLIA